VGLVTSARCISVDVGVGVSLGLVGGFCCLGDMLSVDGDAGAAVETGVRIGWSTFRQLVLLLANRDVSLMVGRLCGGCV